MQAKDLRIGNYTLKFGAIHKVEWLDLGHDNLLTPLPLHDNIFGIIKDAQKCLHGYIIEGIDIELENDGFIVFGSEWSIGMPFKYVHQLQNIIFCLTGEEIEITWAALTTF